MRDRHRPETRGTSRTYRVIAGAAVLFALIAALPAKAIAQRQADPDGAANLEAKVLSQARTQMVAAANPYAVDAGLAILRAGGSAVDAAIAVQLVLNLVEPQSSGIGGGGFLLHWDQRGRRLRSYDGRETAPAAIKPSQYMTPAGQPRGFMEVVLSGESVGVPGLVRMLAMAHARHGKQPWNTLFEPAIALSQNGFKVSQRLSTLLAVRGPERFDDAARAYFFHADGRPRQPGETIRNPDFAATLREIADKGAEAFHSGPIAVAIVRAVSREQGRGGLLALADITGYAARERPVLCSSYRANRICGMGPPSSGGLVNAMTLKLLEPFDLGRAPMNVAALHIIAEAQKLAYADRDMWIADPDQRAVPAGLLDVKYLQARRRAIRPGHAMATAKPGHPPGAPPRKSGMDATVEGNGTTHISIVDRAGNAVALTSSIEMGFGSGLMAGGFLLNNELTDFSFRPRDVDGVPIANAVGPGKRPRSSMSPTIVFDPTGRLLAVLGSPGGSRIPLYVTKNLIGLIDWRLDAQAALDLPNFGNRNGATELEKDFTGALTGLQLQAKGHDVRYDSMASGTHMIVRRRDGTLEGGADPRREGVARGD